MPQEPPGRGSRTAGPHPRHEVRDQAARLAPQLRARGAVMSLRVGHVAVLVGLEAAGDLLGQPVGHPVVGLGRLGRHVGGRHHDLDAVRAQQVDLLLGHLVRHDGDHPVALERGRHREAGAGVAARGLDDRAAGLQLAVALRGLDQGERRAVLDRPARVERLHLRDDRCLQRLPEPGEAHERGVADRIEDRVLDFGPRAGRRLHGLLHDIPWLPRMRALVITEHGPPEVLRVQDRPDPEPGPGEVLVRVRAAGINFADLLARAGLYPDAPKPPGVVGYGFAGELEAAAGDLPAGTRVMGGCRFGAYSERVAANAGNLIPLPDGWSFAEGAARPAGYVTGYAGLVRYGSLREGERVLIRAAAGGVGIAATQVAKRFGAGVYGTASPAKNEAIASFGVDHPVDYRTHDFVDEVRRIAGEERPLDLVFDAIGGRSFRQSFSLLRAG